jgi:hypothetical protein
MCEFELCSTDRSNRDGQCLLDLHADTTYMYHTTTHHTTTRNTTRGYTCIQFSDATGAPSESVNLSSSMRVHVNVSTAAAASVYE